MSTNQRRYHRVERIGCERRAQPIREHAVKPVAHGRGRGELAPNGDVVEAARRERKLVQLDRRAAGNLLGRRATAAD